MEQNIIIEEYQAFINNKAYPCVGAKTAIVKNHLKCMVADHMACPKNDHDILQFLYNFVKDYRKSIKLFHSAAIIFKQPEIYNEKMFDQLLWQRLQALADLDAENYCYDKRVSDDPTSSSFSFSIGQEAFFIIGLHPSSSRLARQFKHPTLVFNPHAQFEKLREENHYEGLKNIIRKRDTVYSGSVNPMLDDFGGSSEVYQYSGRIYSTDWQCPLKLNHERNKHNSTS